MLFNIDCLCSVKLGVFNVFLHTLRKYCQRYYIDTHYKDIAEYITSTIFFENYITDVWKNMKMCNVLQRFG
jgi:hypothetical protein